MKCYIVSVKGIICDIGEYNASLPHCFIYSRWDIVGAAFSSCNSQDCLLACKYITMLAKEHKLAQHLFVLFIGFDVFCLDRKFVQIFDYCLYICKGILLACFVRYVLLY